MTATGLEFLAPTHLELQSRVRALAEGEFAPRAAAWEAEARFPGENLRALADEGLLGLTLPRAYGGREATRLEAVVAIEQLARVCLPTAELCHLCVNGPSYAIARLGSEALQARYLPEVVAGRHLIGISITEEQAGSSLAEIETVAEPDGDGVVVRGRKAFTTGGADFASFLVMARFGGAGLRGLGGLIVAAGTPGFVVERTIPKMGGDAIREAAIRFDGCRVPADHVLVPGDAGSTAGFKLMMSAYNQLRCGLAAICLGVGQAALDDIGRFLNQRHQFGAPLASFQGLRWRVAELAVDLEAARLLTYRAAQISDEYGFAAQYPTAVAKLAASRVAVRAADEAIQMLGWRGVAREGPAERRYREIRGWTIAGGSTEALLDVIGARVLRSYSGTGGQ